MKIDVFDTYASSREGKTIHFDVFLPQGKSAETALGYARQFLESIGEPPESAQSHLCRYCHSEIANPLVEAEIEKSGHFILQMEGCPNPYG